MAAATGPLPAGAFAYIMISQLAVLGFNAFVLHVVRRLERSNCACAKDWRLDFVARFTAFKLAWLVGVMIAAAVQPCLIAHPVFHLLASIVTVMSLVNLIVALQYLTRLRDQHCKCAESVGRTVWEVVLWTQVAWLAVVVLASFALAVGVVTSAKTTAARAGASSAAAIRRRR